MITLEHPEVLRALDFVYQERLSKAYTMKRPGNAYDEDFRHQGKSIPRPNHGLPHVVRTVCYVPFATRMMAGGGTSPEVIHQMMLARVFFITGRENEVSHTENEAQYNQFRAASANLYRSYVAQNNDRLKYPPATIDFFASIINRHYDKYEDHLACKVLRACHDLDLMRCDAQYPGILSSYCTSYPGLKKLGDHIDLFLQETGDQNCVKQMGYNGDHFVRCSTDVRFCIQKIKGVVFKVFSNAEENLGFNSFMYGLYQKAMQHYLKADLLDVDPELYLRIGRVYQEACQSNDALVYFQAAAIFKMNTQQENFGLFYNLYCRLCQQAGKELPNYPYQNEQQFQTEIPNLKKMTFFVFPPNSNISDGGLQLIEQLPALTYLDMSNAKGYTAQALERLKINRKTLVTLKV